MGLEEAGALGRGAGAHAQGRRRRRPDPIGTGPWWRRRPAETAAARRRGDAGEEGRIWPEWGDPGSGIPDPAKTEGEEAGDGVSDG